MVSYGYVSRDSQPNILFPPCIPAPKRACTCFIVVVAMTPSLDPEAGCPNFFEGRTPPAFSYKRIPIFDNRGEDILQYMEGAISFIEQSKHYGSVLVHCNKGVSRSASFVIGYACARHRDESVSISKDSISHTITITITTGTL